MIILTIIVPSYNTSRFMDKCLPTFVDEQLKNRMEVLIINDGSTDDTSKKGHQYEAAHPDIFRVIDKKNGGHGSGINRGVQESVGKYCKVVDGDDWVETENLVWLVDTLEHTDADVILNPYFTVNASKNDEKKLLNIPVEPKEWSFNEIAERIQQFQIHTMTIKTEILRKIHLTEHCFYEDFEYDLFPVPYVNTVKVLDYPVYNYVIGQKSQSVSDASVLKNHMMERTILFESIKYYEHMKNRLNGEKDAFFIKNICTLGRQTYNVYFRNYKDKSSFRLFMEFDQEFAKKAAEYHDKVLDQYAYIRMACSGNKWMFVIAAKMLIVYKKISERHNSWGIA